MKQLNSFGIKTKKICKDTNSTNWIGLEDHPLSKTNKNLWFMQPNKNRVLGEEVYFPKKQAFIFQKVEDPDKAKKLFREKLLEDE